MDIRAYISSGIIESYVLGLASGGSEHLELYSKNNVEVEQAIIEAETALEELADSQAMEMPMQLKQEIWNKLIAENLVPSEDQEVNEVLQPTSTGHSEVIAIGADKKTLGARSYTWTVAASLLLAVSIGANIFLYQRKQDTVNKLNQTTSLLDAEQEKVATLQNKWALVQNPAIKTIPLKGVRK